MIPGGGCFCSCHVSEVLHFAPDVRDPIAAATACSHCLAKHCPALVAEWPVIPPLNPRLAPWMAQGDGEGAET